MLLHASFPALILFEDFWEEDTWLEFWKALRELLVHAMMSSAEIEHVKDMYVCYKDMPYTLKALNAHLLDAMKFS